jgi:adiponectin receptor
MLRFHIISNHSPRVAALGNQLDYLGVLALMWGATVSTVYYGFCDDPMLQDLHWTVVSANLD